MKNFIKTFTQSLLFCAIAFTAVIGFSMASCSAAAAVPEQLVGTWSTGGNEVFKITSDRKFSISGSGYNYVIMSSSTLGAASGTIVVGYEKDEIGRFNYILSGSTMTISSGTASLVDFSGFVLTK